MILSHKVSFNENMAKIENSIINWSESNERFLNIVTVPYSSSKIFITLILKLSKKNKKTLYITNEDINCINLIKEMKKNTSFRDYTYIRKTSSQSKSRLKVCNFENAIMIEEKFDLIIYDDITSFPCRHKCEMMDLMSKLSNCDSKFIAYSTEVFFKEKREIIIPIRDINIPMVEPRSIITRIDINKDIPFVVYDYLKWSMYSGRKIIICVPDEERLYNVSFYIKEYCKNLGGTLICFLKDKSDKKHIDNFEKIKRSILITDDFEKTFIKSRDVNVMVYFANDYRFDCKKLIYFCGSVGRSVKDIKGEVIFLANEESQSMEVAKNITRNFNKEAWEMGLLSI